MVPVLEPLIRKWVQEAVVAAVDRIERPSYSGIAYSGSRTLQLQFCSKLPGSLYTGSRILSEDGSPVRLTLRDSISKQVVTSGPFSSARVNIVALNGDFDPDDQIGWTKEDFDRYVVQNREGRRPLLTGDLAISLQNGEGQIDQVIFTDNSSWMRSRKFRLGAQVHLTTSDEISIREAMTNCFKILDHRGESYRKHYPPSLADEVWRLEKIAKHGKFHNRLTSVSIFCVRDFLRWYETSQHDLRSVLGNISNKMWNKIIQHATSCILDDQRYTYTPVPGTELFFNSVYKLVGVRLDGQIYDSLDTLNVQKMRMVEDLKQLAYRNMEDWILDTPAIAYPNLPINTTDHFNHPPTVDLQDKYLHVDQGQPELQINNYHQPTISSLPSNAGEANRHHASFEIGESSQMQQGFNPGFRNSIGMTDYSPSPFFGSICLGSSPLCAEDLPPANNHFHGEPSSSSTYDMLFSDSNNHEISPNSAGIMIPRNLTPKTRWYKLLSVVKWRILVKRSVAARKWKQFFDYM
ncbi:calmodulin-binding protein 60 B-like isoform X6 [Andrographis paniculata]|nr:calmodulin-binding protein 60 B-like isoform X6 [Andrographis paniculata]XP_051146687.1 calmodulin-binding protein 60 B-like isoform X6 [Andrographis paniculata]